jgi:hypothetical protein
MVLRAFVVSLSLGVAAVSPLVAFAQTGAATTVPPEISTLSKTLMIGRVMDVMRAEGLKHAADLSADLLTGQGDDAWRAVVEVIYDTEKMTAHFDAKLAEALAGSPVAVADSAAFFTSPSGQRVLTLELEARMTLLDEAAEAAAKAVWDKTRTENSPRVPLLTEFATANDLIESNVMGALNANLAFYRGLSSVGAFGAPMPEDQMLAEVWGQEPEIRTETTDWLYPFLMLSYQPLSDAELQSYIDFSITASGQKLNAAVFMAFDAVMVDLSRDLGTAAGQLMLGRDI